MVTVPSPQCVGREFVRQYYTLLNQEPVQIHRFYTKQSWFLHGRAENGPTELPVIGQEAIYSKIKDLNFHDCHTKIRQVDSHSTVGGGVVVQVSGELSNDGQPMRRFMQTFVLAPEGPRKYYVHNDIFRYQDEVFSEETSDEPADGNVDSEGEEDLPQQVPVNSSSVGSYDNQEQDVVQENRAESLYYSGQEQTNGSGGLMNPEPLLDNGNDEESLELQEVIIDKQPQMNPHEAIHQTAIMQPPEEDDFVAEPSNGQTEETSYEQQQGEGGQEDEEEEEEDEEEAEEEELEGTESDAEANIGDTSGEPLEPVPEKPKTWAALAASRALSVEKNTTPVSSSRPVRQTPQAPPQPVIPPPPRPQAAATRPSKEVRGGLSNTDSRLTARNAPDNHQVFIGNLPSGVKDEEVRNVFSKYGIILEIRLNPKNFGFVIFNSPDPVEQILNNRPIRIGNHVINIEEKKPSGSVGRGAGGNRRGGGGGGGGGTRGNARGGPSGGGGGQAGRGGSGGPRTSNRGGFGGKSNAGSAGGGSSGRTGGRRDSGGRGGKFK
ncbi:ras GTPase-activating protein-binding protein 2-like [Montipora foliosa]|uniref:ras GTPase-activating protein-binding protein 2-like n=1 Tax=Montipora foliosa TaxID=591990 RepID=UPI0035F148FF